MQDDSSPDLVLDVNGYLIRVGFHLVSLYELEVAKIGVLQGPFADADLVSCAQGSVVLGSPWIPIRP